MEKAAICYFSATGNGMNIAQEMQKNIDGDIFSIQEVNGETLQNYDKTVMVFPVYCFGLPNIVKNWIETLKNHEIKNCYVVLHYGGFAGNAANYTKRFLADNGIQAQAIFKLTMPESFTIYGGPPEFWMSGQLKKAVAKVARIAEKIKSNHKNNSAKNIFAFTEKMHEKAAAAWSKSDKNFIITDSCTSCGHCAQICPVSNIVLEGGRPQFKGGCISCLACYHRCPESAINYGEKTIGKKRYINPNVNL